MKCTSTKGESHESGVISELQKTARRRQRLAMRIAERLETSAEGNPALLAEVDIIREVARSENIYWARDLDRENEEFYDGLGALWHSGSRLDPIYRIFERTRIRHRVRDAVSRVQPGRLKWRFITLTMPLQAGVPIGILFETVQSGWRLFNKRKWWIDTSRAGVKSIEFTLGDEKKLRAEKRQWSFGKDGYHVHLHLLVLADWVHYETLRRVWTECVTEAGVRRNLFFQFNTSHGEGVVHVRLVTKKESGSNHVYSLEDAIQEVCKYITKMESAIRIPSDQLPALLQALRHKRMVELFGECRSSKKQESATQTAEISSESSERRTYLDTDDISAGMSRAKPLREIGVEMISNGHRNEWRRVLRERVERVQQFRRNWLAEHFQHATFFTLNGQKWRGRKADNPDSFPGIFHASAVAKAFSEVSVDEFAVFKEGDRQGDVNRMRTDELQSSIPALVRQNRRSTRNLIVEPLGENLIQAKFADHRVLGRLRSIAFLVTEESPGQFRALLPTCRTITNYEREKLASQLFTQIPGLHRPASNEMLWPGSFNHITSRRGTSVRIIYMNPGKLVTENTVAALRKRKFGYESASS